MRQFAICELRPARSGRRGAPVIVLQHDFYSNSRTRIVAPLMLPSEIDRVERLTLDLDWNGRAYLIALHQMATVDLGALGPELGYAMIRDQLMRATDLLFCGF